MTYLESLFVVLDVVAINVVVRSDGFSELDGGDHARALGGRTAGKEHDAGACAREAGLEKAGGHAEGDAGASLGSLVVGDGPRVSLEALQNAGQTVLALAYGQQEASASGERRGLSRGARCRSNGGVHGGVEAKHVLDLLGTVVLGASEHVGLGALGVAQLMDLGLLFL